MKVWTSLKTSKNWNDLKKPLATIFHPLAHIGSSLPLLVGLWDFWQNDLGANPILEITHRSGKTAITLLIISLAISPFNKLRRPLGLWSGFYALVHFSIYVVLDYGFQLKLLLANSLSNPFIWFGFTAGFILLLLSITSLNVVLKKMGKNWKKLHRFVYAAGILAAVHFILAVKPGVIRPWPYALAMAVVLSFRLPPIQKALKQRPRRRR